jgi:hypothetical protein
VESAVDTEVASSVVESAAPANTEVAVETEAREVAREDPTPSTSPEVAEMLETQSLPHPQERKHL